MTNPFQPGYYDEKELAAYGFKSVGSNVRVARICTIVGLENISIGSNVRIDGCTAIVAAGTGWVSLGSYIHIGCGCHLSGR